MSAKYWTGVVLGMLAVFAAGMLVARGVQRGKALVTSNFPVSLALFDGGFRVDGQRVGDVQRLQFMRSMPGRVDSAVLTVKPSSDSAAADLSHCVLRVTSHDQVFGSGTHFYCASHTDSAVLHLQRFGHVVFLPDSVQVALYVPQDVAEREHMHAYRGMGGDAGDVDIEGHDGSFSLRVNNQELVHLSGGDSGGSVVIRNASGRPLVEIHGDSNGGSVKVTDANGKTRVDVHGGPKDSH